MTRSDHWRRFHRRRMTRAMAMSLSFAALFIGGGGAQTPDQTFVSVNDVVLYPPNHRPSSFRYLPGGSPLPFDRNLVLSAAPGETRTYIMQMGADASVESGEAPVVAYVVDKSRPGAPKAEPGTGLYYGALSPSLAGEKGSDIFWALVGPDGITGAFVPYGPDSRPRISPPAAGVVTYTLLAYSVKGSGTRSYPSRFVYRIAEPGLPAMAPRPDTMSLAADPSLPKPAIVIARGYAELSISLPPGASLITDFKTGVPPSALDDFERIEAEDGIARLRVPCPYAWSGDVGLYYGMLKDGAATYYPQPLVLHLAYAADEPSSSPADPPAPVLAADQAGRGAFLAFPAYDGDIYVSIGNAKPVLYTSPIALPGETTSARVAWYGEDASGLRSATHSQVFYLPASLPDVELTGAAEGSMISGDVLLKPAINAVTANDPSVQASIRYELRVDGSFPPEPSISSPVLGDGLAITCPPGEERSVVIRYRRMSRDAASEGRILRFTLDRKPPEAPGFRELPADSSDRPLSIELAPSADAKEVFASVSADGAPAPFLPVAAPIELAGSESGPVDYLIRAYDVDAAGNRSQEMKAVSLVVDRSAVYVAEDGDDRGDGSPGRPYRSLDLALAAALRRGVKSVNMRGSLEMRAGVLSSSEMSISGGFGKSWTKDGSMRASVRVVVPQDQSAFSQHGGSLSLSRVELRAESAGSAPLIELSGASLSVADSTLIAGSDGDFILISAGQSKINLADSRIQALRAMSFTAFSSDQSDISLSGSSISAARDVRMFDAVDMDGGALSIRESLVESRADLGLSLFSLRSASLLVDRSLIAAEGGSGFLRLGTFKAVSGEMKNSKVILSWKGPGTLFEAAEGGPSFRYDTITAGSSTGPLRFFDLRGGLPQIWNCVLDNTGNGAELLRSDSLPGAGTVVADCVWGFDKLLAGAVEASDLQSLNALNAGSALYSSKPIVSEPPESSFAAPLKSQAPLRKGSACVGAAFAIERGYEVDFGGHPRPAPGKAAPDIGADELSD